MNSLSYTQEFFLCSFDSKGNRVAPILSLDSFAPCLFVSGITELIAQGSLVSEDTDTLDVVKPPDDSLSYLKPLYDAVASFKKPRKLPEIVGDLSFSTGKKSGAILAAVGTSLVAAGCADELAGAGLFKHKTKYASKPEAVSRVIERVRAELLAGEAVSDETAILTTLLDKCDILKSYFSKTEAPALKKRMKELRGRQASAPINKTLDYIDEITAMIVVAMSVATD
jgi:hypothetical protein